MPPRNALSLLALAVLIGVAYGASLRNEFVHDDVLFMGDPRVQSLAALPRLLHEPRWGFGPDSQNKVHQYYRPFEPLPYALAHLLDGGRAGAAHALNLALHLLNTALFLALARLWLGPPALLVAALFAVYPAYSEAVLWPAAAGGLGAFACTWSIFLLNVGTAPRWWTAPVTALLFAAALLFKETGAMAPVYVLLGWWLLTPRQPSLPRRALALAAATASFAFYLALRRAALGQAMPRLEYLPFSGAELLLNAAALVPTFARALAWPFALCFHHDFNPVHDAAQVSVWLGAGTAVAALAAVLALRRRAPVAAFGIAAVGAAALPYLVLHKPADNVFAERYLYDLAPGACLTLGAAIQALARRLGSAARRAAIALLAATLLLFIGVDRARTREWRDEVTLFTRTLAQSPRAEIIRVNLGVRLLRLGRNDEAIAVLEELRRIDPHYRNGLENLALAYHAAGRLDDAVAALEAALVDRPRATTTLLNLAYFYDEQGRRFDAVRTYFRAVAVDPSQPDVWNNLAIIALEEGQLDNARRAARRLLDRNPGDRGGAALLQRAATAPARDAAPGATRRRCDEARALADAGRYPLAVASLRAAAWLDERSPLPHQYLANVHVLAGNPRAALRHQREALRRDPGNALYRRNLRALRRDLARQQMQPRRAATPGVDSAAPRP